MRVSDIMTPNPTCCTLESSLEEAAQMMIRNDCGAIPVVEDDSSHKPVGIITDRDIVVRAVAEGKNTQNLKVKDCCTQPVETVSEHAEVEDATATMEQSRVRRMLVVNADGRCCGILSQADIATKYTDAETVDVVRRVSQPA